MKHTPGPWEIIEQDSTYTIQNPIVDDQDSGTSIYDPVVWEMGGIDNLANARLIAAAPDLLAACEVAIKMLEIWPPAEWEYRETQMHEVLQAAVAKARGD